MAEHPDLDLAVVVGGNLGPQLSFLLVDEEQGALGRPDDVVSVVEDGGEQRVHLSLPETGVTRHSKGNWSL